MNAFLQQHASRILGVLKGWDRLRLRGTLCWLAHPKGLAAHLRKSGRALEDFKHYATECSKRLGQAAEELAGRAKRPVIHLRRGGIDKEEMARQIARRDGVEAGLICTLRATENCWSFKLGRDREGLLRLYSSPRRCNHLYHYLIHPVFGLMHLRLQTWLPFNVHLCVNGREWLSRQMDRAGIKYIRKDNCFPWIQDLEAAQELMNRQVDFHWEEALNELAGQLVPGIAEVVAPGRAEYYWSIEESEWASDTLFVSEQELSGLYPALVRRGMECFGSRQVMRFLGQKVPLTGNAHARDYREMVSVYKQRPEGVCLKHRLGKNTLKCYNKQGSVFRVETTINDPKAFRVPRRDEAGKVTWPPMRKGVADARRRAEVSDQATERYLESLAAVGSPVPLKTLTAGLSRRVNWGGEKVRGLKLLEEEDAKLLEIVGRGEFLINGFRNRDLQGAWFAQAAADAGEQRRRCGQMTRKIRLLRAHGLIRKLPHTHRYLVTPEGRQAIAALQAAGNADIAQLTKAA